MKTKTLERSEAGPRTDAREAPRATAQEGVFWEIVPEDVIGVLAELTGADYGRECRDKKDKMEKATGGTWTDFEWSPRLLQLRECAKRGFWENFVDDRPFRRDSCIKHSNVQPKAVFSYAGTVMDKICGWEDEESGWVRNSPKMRSFSRDEWNHLLRLFNIMIFSMFSCGHISDFLSGEQVRKQSAMSKRGQEATSKEGSPMGKARPCLVARDPRSEEISAQSLEYLVNPRNADERKEVEIADGNSWRFASRQEVGYSQASRQEDAPTASRKLVREDLLQTDSDERKQFNSNNTGKLAASSPELRNVEYTNHQYMSKIFQFLRKRLGI